MKYTSSFCLLFCLLFQSAIYAQRGKSGPEVVSSTITVNEYTALTADAAIGNTSITVAGSALNSHGRFPGNLASGDLVMIIQMQGATINGTPDPLNTHISTPNDSSWGAVLNYNNCGNNEIREVLSVPNGTTINLTCPLVNNYTAAGKVQIVRIPRYSSLTINTGGQIVPDFWDSVSGGIIAIEVLGNTVINNSGQINATASGFRGGILQNSNSIATGITYVASNQPNINGAFKGESIAGNGSDYNVFGGRVCMGAPANGGGGGDSWNAGGGGGANGGNVSGWINGFGIPDISNPNYITAWNLEYTWMSSFIGAGGGRGGYTWSNTQDPLTDPPGDPSWGGDDRRSVGGRGGHPLDYTTGRLFFGGGGGAGSEDNNHAGPGGNGGGMIYLVSYGTISGNGIILANGHNGVSDSVAPGDGPGGAGAGGTIIVNSTGAISGVTLEANGATGGNQTNTAPEAEGPGGGGSGGYIAISNGSITEQVNGGPNGLTATLPTFPANGATQGGPGDTSHVTNFIISANNDSICSNNTATLNATLSGTVPAGTTIEWYDSLTGGNLLGTGPSYTTPVIHTTTVFYVATCPGDYRQADTVFVKVANATISSPNDSICKGDTALLVGSGGTTYTWSTSQTTDSIKVAPLSTTTYTLTITKNGCIGDTVFTVHIRPAQTALVSAVPDSICPGINANLMDRANGSGLRYKWSTGATTSSVGVTPLITTKYIVTTYGICDSLKDTVTVTVIPLPKPVITGTNWKCKGIKDTLNVSSSNNPTNYRWSNGSTSTTIITGAINADTTIYVTAENSLGCTVTDSFKIAETNYPGGIIKYIPGCGNTPTHITATPLGSGPFTYLWNTGGTNDTINVNIDSATTYTVVISNGCPTTKVAKVTPYVPSISACCNSTIIIGGDTSIKANGTNIVKYSWYPTTGLNCDTCPSVIASPTATTTYTVTGTDASGCTVEQVVTIIVDNPCFSFTIPNVFTPTTPGILGVDNEFYINTMYSNLSSWSVTIFDRWGKEMFNSSNPSQYWKGNTESGGQAPAGVYYYIIDGVCSGTTYKKDGFVQLIR